MSTNNPYDDYDVLDPWDDDTEQSALVDTEDATGSFDFNEDDYDPLDVSPSDFGEENEYEDDPVGSTAPHPVQQQVQPIERTQVRSYGNVVSSPSRVPQAPRPVEGILHRHGHKHTRGAVPAPNPQQMAQQSYVSSAQDPRARRPGRAPRMPRQRRRHHFGCLLTILLFVGVLVAAGVALYWQFARPIDERLAFDPQEQQRVSSSLSWSFPTTPSYILALGSDAREGDVASRTDTMMLIRVDFWRNTLTMVSIPRDTKVELAGHGMSKINAAYAYGGAAASVRAVSELLDVPINHVAVVHFEELVDLVNYLGGVTLDVPMDMYDPSHTGVALSSGVQTLSGEEALAFARTRYGLEGGDYQRQADQRILLGAIMTQLTHLPVQDIPGAINQVSDMVSTDMRCYDLGPLFLCFKFFNPTVYSCAVPTTSSTEDGVSYEIVDESSTKQLMDVVKRGENPATLGYKAM